MYVERVLNKKPRWVKNAFNGIDNLNAVFNFEYYGTVSIYG